MLPLADRVHFQMSDGLILSGSVRVHRGREWDKAPKHAPDDHPETGQSSLNAHQLSGVFGVNCAVIDRIPNVIQLVSFIWKLEALIEVPLSVLAKTNRQGVSSLTAKARINDFPEAVLDIFGS